MLRRDRKKCALRRDEQTTHVIAHTNVCMHERARGTVFARKIRPPRFVAISRPRRLTRLGRKNGDEGTREPTMHVEAPQR